jgi:hypothetical protein
MTVLSTDGILRNFTAEDFAAFAGDGGGGGTPTPDPDPTITSLVPATGVVNTPITVTVNGTNFVSGSVVESGAIAVSTTFVSATKLTANFTASTAGAKTVTVRNPSGMESGNATFTVTAAAGATATKAKT